MIGVVKLSKRAKKDIEKVPSFIALKLAGWIEAIENEGLAEVRKISGLHDEPLKGDRKGQRSIRLNRSYRAIYEINKDGSIEFVEVQEVNKHEY